ncbi:MAG: ATP/GTP-binding protein [Collimonas sp.]|uniref:GTP-binding protein n=1 Tax=Collimonas sp. TaxID=1963772 RepID=UPI003264B726
MQRHKLIFLGSPGVGKTTAIRAVSDESPVCTDVQSTDEHRSTTVALDFGELTLADGDVLHLFGVPGQERFKFIWPLVVEGAMGLILMVDNSQETPFDALDFYLNNFSWSIAQLPTIVAVTRMRPDSRPQLADYVRHLGQRNFNLPVVAMDPRERKDVLFLLNMVVALIEKRVAAWN